MCIFTGHKQINSNVISSESKENNVTNSVRTHTQTQTHPALIAQSRHPAINAITFRLNKCQFTNFFSVSIRLMRFNMVSKILSQLIVICHGAGVSNPYKLFQMPINHSLEQKKKKETEIEREKNRQVI